MQPADEPTLQQFQAALDFEEFIADIGDDVVFEAEMEVEDTLIEASLKKVLEEKRAYQESQGNHRRIS